MKKIAYIMCFLCICMCSNAQQQNTINKMINDSMHSFLNWYFSIADNINYGEDRPILYVCTDYLPYDFGFSEFFSQKSEFFSQKSVRFMSSYDIGKLKELKKEKGCDILLTTIELKQNYLTIKIKHWNLKRRKKQLYMGFSCVGIYTYEYSCDDQEWKLIDTKYRGI